MTRRRRPSPAALLAGLVGVLAVALYVQAVKVGGWSPDEEYFVDLSRVLVEEFPRSLWDVPEVVDYNDRGLQRLLPLLLGLPLGVVGGEPGMRLAHALLCLAFASTAIPAYLLARGVRLTAGWALAAALLVVLTPWAVLATGFLTETIAYPLSLWAFWAAWRACVVPGVRSDLLAVGLVLAAGLARTSLLTLVVVAPLAVTAHAVLTGRVRALPREHPLLTAFAVVGAAVVVVSLAGGDAFGVLGGSYNTSLTQVDWGPLPEKFAGQIARIVSGTGFVLAVLALPWALAQLARRRAGDAPAQALAAVALAGGLALLLSTIYAAPEERYLLYAAPLVVVPGIAALARRDVPAWAVAVAGLAAAVLVDRVLWPFAEDPALFQTDAARTFLSRAVLSRVSVHVVAALVLGAAFVLAVIVARQTTARRAARGAGLVLAGLVALQLVQTGFVVGKRVSSTHGGIGLHERTWIDRAADGEDVLQFGDGIANTTAFEAAWREAAFYNRRIEVHAAIGGGSGVLVPRHAEIVELDLDEDTGALTPRSGRPLPRLWLTPTVFHPTALVADPVARSAYLPLQLLRMQGEPRAVWRWSDVEPDGWIGEEEPEVTLQLFDAARAPGACLAVTLVAPPSYRGEHRYRLRAGATERRGGLRAEEREIVEVPITPELREVRLEATGTTEFVEGRQLSLQIGATQITPCD